ncbi:hypothetical protein GOV13_02455 [Candidatus Pacearchaeota archaeon]|nr:hypothetical protein [Candidatus Pacearchaeota archaeon]
MISVDFSEVEEAYGLKNLTSKVGLSERQIRILRGKGFCSGKVDGDSVTLLRYLPRDLSYEVKSAPLGNLQEILVNEPIEKGDVQLVAKRPSSGRS